MPQGSAARLLDPVAHPLPPVLSPGPGSPNVLIGVKPAWRGLPLAAVAALQAAKTAADTAINTAVAATAAAAAGTPAAPAAYAAEQAAKTAALATMSATITAAGAGGTDIHNCATPSPVPPHGPGVVVNGSASVQINNLPACRMGDTLLEAIGPPNSVTSGDATVVIGG